MKDFTSQIIAHRGASFNAPENTLSAIQLAWNLGVKKVEIDVHLSKDHQIVVIHDENTKRLTGKDTLVKDQTLVELKGLEVGVETGVDKIPTLKEVLKTIPKESTLIIEIKCGKEIIPILKREIATYSDVFLEFICFDYGVISEVKKSFPNYKSLWLLDLDYTNETKKEYIGIESILKKTKQANLDGIDVWAGKIADKNFVSTVKSANLLLYIWSTNSVDLAKYFLKLGVDAITTDRPKWILDQL
ncbi:glycerophosphodiester phosphodiesterase family protein [Polaribacter gochangensis]|uniref:glycerophosphodiester phosphodiesterase family protein n=1 Tax=Polaribacter gochangensis TaxID=3252903 RepID=UPI0039049F9F